MEYKVIEPSGKIATMISTEAEGSLPIDDSASGLGQVLTLGNNTQTGEYTFDFTTAHPDAKFITQNNLISFKDKYSKDRLYTITRVEDTGTGTATAYCYDYLLVLINSIADSWDYTGDPHPIAFYVDKLIANTGMQIGINEISNLSRALKFDGESDTYLTRLGDVANQFGGAEVDCSVETDGIKVTGIYINIYKHIGKTTLVQDFITGINLDHTERTIDIDRLRTALKAKGGTPDGENQKPITFADIAYDDGQYYTPKGDPVLYDRINGELWSQTRITNSDKIGWIFDNYSYDTLDPQLLLTHTLTKLKSVNTPEATYTVNSVNFEGDIGDSVRVTDLNYEPELYLKARVSQVNNHYTAQGLDTGVLANYELLRSEIDPNVKSELDKISKLPGKPGKDGVGIKETIIAYQLGSSDTDAPTGTWTETVPTLVKGMYLWTRTTLTYTDNSSEPVYSVTYIAKDGNSGKDGIAGKDGVGIKSTVVAYAVAQNGTSVPTTGWSTTPPTLTDGQYLWTRTTLTYTDGTTEPIYSIAKSGSTGTQGPKGDTGKDGLAGKDGLGIKSTKITYQLGSSGTTKPTGTWLATVPTLTKGQYLWTKTTWNYSDNTTEDGFSVAYIAKDGSSGADGLPGKDGTGIKSTVIEYAVSSNGVTKPSTGWSATIPSVAPGQFMWTRTTWLYTDGTNEVGYSVAQAGKTGAKGDTGSPGKDGIAGKDGVGIKSTNVTYQASSNGTTAPIGAWTANVPNTSKGQYLWTKTVWTYTDNTTETGYSVSYIAKDGNDGTNGVAGKDGVGIKSTTITYANSTSGTTAPTSGWKANPPATSAGQFIWTKTIWTYTDGTNETGYSVGKIGEKGDKGADGAQGTPGKAGADGRTPYFHQAWADSQDGKTGFSTTISLGKKYLGTYADYTGAGSTDPTKYQWMMTAGAAEENANNHTDDAINDVNSSVDNLYDVLGNKADADEFKHLQDQAQSLQDSYEAFVSNGGKYESDLTSLEDRATQLYMDLGEQLLQLSFVNTWFKAGDEGLSIGSADSSVKLLISNDQLSFTDGGQTVAYFTAQSFYINKGAVVTSLQVNQHKLSRIDSNHTAFVFIS